MDTPGSRIAYTFWPNILCCLAWIALFAAIAVAYGPDGTWDLRNYHIYGPYALLHGRMGRDIAPAQYETYYLPLLDIPSYALRFWLNRQPRLLDAVLSLPHGIGAFLATLIARRFIPTNRPWRWPAAMALAAIGATGAAGLPTVSTGQSEMLPGCFTLGGFLLLLRTFDPGRIMPAPSRRTLLGAGLLFGIAAGLKLTEVPYCIGAVAAVLLIWPGTARDKLVSAFVLGFAICVGMVLLAGWWWLHLWRAYGNPLFPLYNGIFRSPYWQIANYTDNRFKPKSLAQALFYPFYWGLRWNHLTTEPVMRDPRFMLAYVAFWAMVVRRAKRLPDARGTQIGVLLTFAGVSYAAWEALFSILRYLAPLEMLIGIIMVLPLRALAERRRGLPVAGLAAAMAIVLILRATVYPDWGRAQAGPTAVSVSVPPLDPHSLVLLLDVAPMGYLAPYMPHSVRIVGLNNRFLEPGQRGLLQARVEHLVRTYPGPIYGLEDPQEWPGSADRALAHYGLRRERADCARVRSNLDQDRILLCPLTRDNTPPATRTPAAASASR